MKFKYKLADIPPEGVQIPLELPAQRLQEKLNEETGEHFRIAAPLGGSLKLEAAKEKIIAKGRVRTVFRMACSRCLEDFDLDVGEDVFVVFSPLSDDESSEELEADQLSQEVFSGDEIDLWPTIEEHLMLGLPIKALCREDCTGLCSVCGQNRNQEACQCSPATGHPGFAALEKLKEKLPK